MTDLGSRRSRFRRWISMAGPDWPTPCTAIQDNRVLFSQSRAKTDPRQIAFCPALRQWRRWAVLSILPSYLVPRRFDARDLRRDCVNWGGWSRCGVIDKGMSSAIVLVLPFALRTMPHSRTCWRLATKPTAAGAGTDATTHRGCTRMTVWGHKTFQALAGSRCWCGPAARPGDRGSRRSERWFVIETASIAMSPR